MSHCRSDRLNVGCVGCDEPGHTATLHELPNVHVTHWQVGREGHEPTSGCPDGDRVREVPCNCGEPFCDNA